MQPDEPTEEERLEELPQDNGTPFQPADPAAGQSLDDTHPSTDSGIEESEAYQDGLPDAAGAEEPRDSGVTSFDPIEEADQDDAL